MKNKTIASILLGLSLIVNLVIGICFGLQEDLFKCVLFLNMAVIFSIFYSVVLLINKIDSEHEESRNLKA